MCFITSHHKTLYILYAPFSYSSSSSCRQFSFKLAPKMRTQRDEKRKISQNENSNKRIDRQMLNVIFGFLMFILFEARRFPKKESVLFVVTSHTHTHCLPGLQFRSYVTLSPIIFIKWLPRIFASEEKKKEKTFCMLHSALNNIFYWMYTEPSAISSYNTKYHHQFVLLKNPLILELLVCRSVYAIRFLCYGSVSSKPSTHNSSPLLFQ